MITKLVRKEAIQKLCSKSILELSIEEREEILIDMLSDNDEYELIEDFSSFKYNEAIIEYLGLKYKGVKNSYLRDELKEILGLDVVILGEIERMESCPCCEYKSLESRGQYDICKVCFWEDDGSNLVGKFSSVNGMTLADGKKSFLEIGAVSEDMKDYVEPKGKLMFER